MRKFTSVLSGRQSLLGSSAEGEGLGVAVVVGIGVVLGWVGEGKTSGEPGADIGAQLLSSMRLSKKEMYFMAGSFQGG